MKIFTLAGVGAMLLTPSAFAADAQRTTETPPAVSHPGDIDKTTAAPVAGRNSFTKDQAIKRLQENGYTSVSDLTQDDKSIWHGTALKAGGSVSVAVDYQGNITAK